MEPGKPCLPECPRWFRLCTSGGGVTCADNNTIYEGSLVLPKTPTALSWKSATRGATYQESQVLEEVNNT